MLENIGGIVNKSSLRIECPKTLGNNLKTHLFFQNILIYVKNTEKNSITFNMKNTKSLSTNLLVLFDFLFESEIKKQRKIVIDLPNEHIVCQDLKSVNKVIFKMFEFYSEEKRSFFKPRLVGEHNIREKEDILLKYLKELDLKHYDLVKILISEIFANVKMHTSKKESYISGSYYPNNNEIVVSIGNEEYSIAKQLREKRSMIFSDDISAILWTLRKSNSTRNDTETGGLGLYLLRKYIHQLNGKFSILSGTCYLEFEGEDYDEDNENNIHVKVNAQLPYDYQGTMITLHFPYEVCNNKKIITKEKITNISLIDVMG